MNNNRITVENNFMFEPELNSEFREEILRTLQQGICEVTFKKVNGQKRVMPCTLKVELLPEKNKKDLTFEILQERKGDAISVWCTDKNEWRSFKLGNFISIRKLYD